MHLLRKGLGVSQVSECADRASMFPWRVSTYAQQSPVDAILEKGHVILEDLLEIDDIAKVLCNQSNYAPFIT